MHGCGGEGTEVRVGGVRRCATGDCSLRLYEESDLPEQAEQALYTGDALYLGVLRFEQTVV